MLVPVGAPAAPVGGAPAPLPPTPADGTSEPEGDALPAPAPAFWPGERFAVASLAPAAYVKTVLSPLRGLGIVSSWTVI